MKQIGLCEEEEDLLSLLDVDVVADLRTAHCSQYDTEEFLPDLTCMLNKL